MQIIQNQKFPKERDLYNIKDTLIINCEFAGAEDGESALKECQNISLESCTMDLRYPLWHDQKVKLNQVTQTTNCRAALWYSTDISISNTTMNGIKAVRECNNIEIKNTAINSDEFGWRSNHFTIEKTTINSEYIFFEAKDIEATESTFTGKYGFQYIENAKFSQCHFTTKDAFWHGKNIIIENSVIEGEYLGWYSENLTFINCKLIGIQPLCYCKNLRLINCVMENANLSFEYSEVMATIKGNVESIKNPLIGQIEVDSVGEIIFTNDTTRKCEGKVIVNKSIK